MLDVAISGGGVAGASLAYCLARRGLTTALWDRATFPRAKACGEGLLPQGVGALRAMGLAPPEFPRISGLRLVSREGRVAEGDFPGGCGLSVTRARFDAWLLRCAREAGVAVHEGEPFPDRVAARWVVAADGLHSRWGEGRADRPLRIGFSAGVARATTSDKVEIRFRAEGEAYLTPAESGTHVAVLGRASRLNGLRGEELFRRFLDGEAASIATPILGMAPLGRRVRSVVRGNVLLAGDAAGAPDPITGEGMSLALRGALVAAEAIAANDVSVYAAWRLREGESARRLGRWFLRMSPFSDRTIRSLARRPELMRRLMRVTCGLEPAPSPLAWMKVLLG